MTPLTQELRLAPTVEITAVEELAERWRDQLPAGTADGQFAVSRPNARSRSRLVDDVGRRLIEQFRQPTRLVDAVLAVAGPAGIDPAEALEGSLPLVVSLVGDRVLLGPEDVDEDVVPAVFSPGDTVLGVSVGDLIYSLEDTQIFRGDSAGEAVAVKVALDAEDTTILQQFAREARILRHLDGRHAPRLHDHQRVDGRPVLVMAWVDGTSLRHAISRAVAQDRAAALDMVARVAEAYAGIHEAGVMHGDVHPGNVLVTPDGGVVVIDFGEAVLDTSPLTSETANSSTSGSGSSHRGGVTAYYEPELAQAHLTRRSCPVSRAGEQYAVATMALEALLDHHPLDLSLDMVTALHQIAEQDPAAVDTDTLAPGTAAVLARARSVRPADRHASLQDLAAALRQEVGDLASPALPDPVVVAGLALPSDAGGPGEGLADRILATLGVTDTQRIGLPALAPRASLFYGGAGVGSGLLALARLTGDPDLLAVSRTWADLAVSHQGDDGYINDEFTLGSDVVRHTSPFHGSLGPRIVLLQAAAAQGDTFTVDTGILALLGELAEARGGGPDRPGDAGMGSAFDPMMGAASTVTGICWLLDLPALSGDLIDLLTRALGDAVDAVVEVMHDRPRIPRDGGASLGAAHGWAGVLRALLLAAEHGCDRIGGEGVARVDQLAGLATVRGGQATWPAFLHPDGSHGPVMGGGWCNGSAGFIPLFCAAFRHTGDAAYLGLARAAGRTAARERSAVHNLCCGSAGKALMHLRLHRVTQEEEWLRAAKRAVAEGDRLSTGELAVLTQLRRVPLSLFKGDLGLALADAATRHPEMSIDLLG